VDRSLKRLASAVRFLPATIFSITCRPSEAKFHSISFQDFWPVEIRLRRNEARLESVSWGRIVLSSGPLHFRNHRHRCNHRHHHHANALHLGR